MLVPGRTFSVRGLCKMHGVPDIQEVLEAKGWLRENKQGWTWRGPRPQDNEAQETLLREVIDAIQGPTPPPKPKQGRPKTNTNGSSAMYLRVTENLRERIEVAADDEGRTISNWMRRAIEYYLDHSKEKDAAAVSLGKKGGESRALALSPDRRSEIAKNAAKKRWWRIEDDLEEMKTSPEE